MVHIDTKKKKGGERSWHISYIEILFLFLKFFVPVVVISKTILAQFGQAHADAVVPLNKWWEETKKADWSSLEDIKKTFNSVDYVGNDRYVFNVKGNKYRLVAMIFFDIRTVYVRFIDTHTKYDKIDCSTT